MKKLIDEHGDTIRCGFCKKEITDVAEIEYSREHNEYYCCPDCATSKYYEYEGSIKIDFDTAQENINNHIYGWGV